MRRDHGQWTIRVVRSYSARTLSSKALLALAAVTVTGSTDPVDNALASAFRSNWPDATPETVPAQNFQAANPQRKYSLASSGAKKIVIMRGDLHAVLQEAKITRYARLLLLRDAELMRRAGHRCLAVAVANIADDGRVAEFFVEGFVALTVEKARRSALRLPHIPQEWVRVELWPATLRFQHWANLALIVVMTITGYYIMNPFIVPVADTMGGGYAESGFFMGWVRFVHYVAGFLWAALAFSRFMLAIVARDRYVRWRALIPIASKQDIKGLWATLQYYLFLKREPPLYVAHNPLQQCAYVGIYVMCILLIGSGMGLYGVYHQTNDFWVFVSYRIHLLGVPMIRLIHSALMFLLWSFVVVHVYMAVRADALERHGGLSSMVNGGVWLRRGSQPVDASEIG